MIRIELTSACVNDQEPSCLIISGISYRKVFLHGDWKIVLSFHHPLIFAITKVEPATTVWPTKLVILVESARATIFLITGVTLTTIRVEIAPF